MPPEEDMCRKKRVCAIGGFMPYKAHLVSLEADVCRKRLYAVG